MFTVVIAALRPSTSQRLPHYRDLNSSSSSPPQAQSVLKVCRFAPPKLCCWLTRRLNRPTSPHPEQPASPPKNSHSPSPFRTHQKEKKNTLQRQFLSLRQSGSSRQDRLVQTVGARRYERTLSFGSTSRGFDTTPQLTYARRLRCCCRQLPRFRFAFLALILDADRDQLRPHYYYSLSGWLCSSANSTTQKTMKRCALST